MKFTPLPLLTTFLLAPALSAQSAVMIQPQLIFTNATAIAGTFMVDINNQAGLATTYQSGVTDFDTYMASSPSGTQPAEGSTFFTPRTNAIFDFDLGATIDLTNMALLNQPANFNGRVVNFQILISDTADFLTFTDLGVHTATSNNAAVGVPIYLEAFDLADTRGRYVRFQVLTNNGSTVGTRFGEIIFAGNPVIPEPSAALLLCTTGLLSLLRRTR